MAASASLHADRTDGRPHTANAQRRANPNSHRGRMIEGHLSYTRFSTTLTDVTSLPNLKCMRLARLLTLSPLTTPCTLTGLITCVSPGYVAHQVTASGRVNPVPQRQFPAMPDMPGGLAQSSKDRWSETQKQPCCGASH